MRCRVRVRRIASLSDDRQSAFYGGKEGSPESSLDAVWVSLRCLDCMDIVHITEDMTRQSE